jgi:hypothetical protein
MPTCLHISLISAMEPGLPDFSRYNIPKGGKYNKGLLNKANSQNE